MMPGNSIEMPSKTKIPITAQITPSRPNIPPTTARRVINTSPFNCLLLDRSTNEDLVPPSSPEHRCSLDPRNANCLALPGCARPRPLQQRRLIVPCAAVPHQTSTQTLRHMRIVGVAGKSRLDRDTVRISLPHTRERA